MCASTTAMGDRGLAIRMGLSLAVLAGFTVAFAAFVLLLFEVLAGAFGIDVTAATRSPFVIGATALVTLGGSAAHGYRRTLDRVDASPTPRSDRPELYAAADRLAAITDIPTPTLAVVESDVANSLAVGRPSNATVVVSTALLERLDDRERDAVLAHEFAHVANYDAIVMELAGALAGITDSIVDRSTRLRTWALDAAKRDENALVVALFAVVTLALAAPFWLCARTVHRLCAQYRELAADRAGAAITGDPAALVSALSTLDESAPPTTDARARDGTQAMCLLPHEFELASDDGWAIEDVDFEFSSSVTGADATSESIGADIDWERLDDIERRHQSQPMYGVDPGDLAPSERVLRFPRTHPPVSTRCDRLRDLHRETRE